MTTWPAEQHQMRYSGALMKELGPIIKLAESGVSVVRVPTKTFGKLMMVAEQESRAHPAGHKPYDGISWNGVPLVMV